MLDGAAGLKDEKNKMRHLDRLRVLLQLTLIIPTSKVLHLLLNFLK